MKGKMMDQLQKYQLMKQLAADLDLLISIWSPEDVLHVRPELTTAQARQVLAAVERYHDANIGVNWDNLKFHADTLFPPESPC